MAILFPLYVAAGMLYLAYGWKRVAPELPSVQSLTSAQLVTVAMIFAVVGFCFWPLIAARDVVRWIYEAAGDES